MTTRIQPIWKKSQVEKRPRTECQIDDDVVILEASKIAVGVGEVSYWSSLFEKNP